MTAVLSGISEIIPELFTAGADILYNLLDGFSEALPGLVDTAVSGISELATALMNGSSKLWEVGAKLISGIANEISKKIPELSELASEIIMSFSETINMNFPEIFSAGIQIIETLVTAVLENLPVLAESAISIIRMLCDTLLTSENLEKLLSTGYEILTTVTDTIIGSLPELIEIAVQIIDFLCTELLSGGYVVIRPEEILIMDTDNIETATKVWRWNSGGLRYSNTGYNGEYGLAMTMDGAIVADYITAGTLRGCEILNGDGTFHVDETGKVTADNITITGGSINIHTGEEDSDVISLSHEGCRASFSPTGLIIRDSRLRRMTVVNYGGFFTYSDYDNANDSHTFSVSCLTGDVYAHGNITTNGSIISDGNIMLSGAVKATGNIEGNGIYGQYLESKGNIKTDGNITGQEIYADNIHFKMDNGNQYSLRTYLTYLEERINNSM